MSATVRVICKMELDNKLRFEGVQRVNITQNSSQMEQLIPADLQQTEVPDGTRNPRRLGHIGTHNAWHAMAPVHIL